MGLGRVCGLNPTPQGIRKVGVMCAQQDSFKNYLVVIGEIKIIFGLFHLWIF
jgi:hypothetical protein